MMTLFKEQALVLLGVEGWRHIEPCIVAALATESPLLLIGEHGTAKSLLLERLADALDLQFRHYNASTINFDDLVGFPVPEQDHIKYLRTPLDAWDAEVLFIDEISRCRIDMQNRLFSIVHEKKMQGQSLDKLRFRWSGKDSHKIDRVGGLMARKLAVRALRSGFGEEAKIVLGYHPGDRQPSVQHLFIDNKKRPFEWLGKKDLSIAGIHKELKLDQIYFADYASGSWFQKSAPWNVETVHPQTKGFSPTLIHQ